LLVEALTLLTSPGLSDEKLTVFVATVDSSAVPVRAGLAREHEITRPIVVSIDRVLAALAAGLMCNGPLIVALQWLALNRGRLRDIMAAGSTRL
jgi:ADP-ribose pyrophosphatase